MQNVILVDSNHFKLVENYGRRKNCLAALLALRVRINWKTSKITLNDRTCAFSKNSGMLVNWKSGQQCFCKRPNLKREVKLVDLKTNKQFDTSENFIVWKILESAKYYGLYGVSPTCGKQVLKVFHKGYFDEEACDTILIDNFAPFADVEGVTKFAFGVAKCENNDDFWWKINSFELNDEDDEGSSPVIRGELHFQV